MKAKQLPISVTEEEKEIFKQVSEYLGLSMGSFIRSRALFEAKRIINQVNKEEQSQD